MQATKSSAPLPHLPAVLEEWAVHISGYAENTRTGYARDVRLTLEALAMDLGRPAELGDLGHDLLQGYIDALEKERQFQKATIARRGASLRAFFRFAAGLKKYCTDAAEHLRLPRMPRRRLPKSLTKTEAELLAEAPLRLTRPDWIGVYELRDAAFLELLTCSGLRVSEACSLNLDQVKLRPQGYIAMRFIGKGDKERLVVVAPGRGVEAVKTYLKRRGEIPNAAQNPALFLNWWGGRVTRRGAYELVFKWSNKSGVRAWPHLLRHTFCSLLVAACGENLRGAQELMGHADPRSTADYSSIDEERLLKTAMKHPGAHPSGMELAERAGVLVADAGRLVWRLVQKRLRWG